jgi:hypothetical protein
LVKSKLVVSVLLVFLALVGSAQAFQWHMRYGQAKHASKEFVEQACREDRKCTGYGVGKCVRISESRFDCEVGTFYAESPGPGEETECNVLLHWGVNRAGYMVLKRHGTPHCFLIS